MNSGNKNNEKKQVVEIKEGRKEGNETKKECRNKGDPGSRIQEVKEEGK